jgi:hypothetical protein
MRQSRLTRWQHAIRDSALYAGAKHVALTLSLSMNTQTLVSWIGKEALARQCAMDWRTVHRALQTIEAEGLLRVGVSVGGAGKTNHYTGLIPSQNTVTTTGVIAPKTLSPQQGELVRPINPRPITSRATEKSPLTDGSLEDAA